MNSTAKPVIVGYDGTEQSKVAVLWAAKTAERRRALLRIIAVTEWDEPIPVLRNEEMAQQALRRSQTLADEGSRLVREQTATLKLAADGLVGNVAHILVEQSANAQLLVVGRSGARKSGSTLPGSVAYTVANQAKCPVAVVRGSLHEMPAWYYPSLVAIDGSESSRLALEVAARWAAESQTPLRIVVGWKTGFLDYEGSGGSGKVSPAQKRANDLAQNAVVEVKAAYPLLEVDAVVKQGRAADVILEAAADVSLIIMGARGRGHLASLLMGSVSREVMARADCPIYIIR